MNDTQRCGCGCGLLPPPGKTFLRGHWSRTPAAKAMYAERRKAPDLPNPSGLCGCGCGQRTRLARVTHTNRGRIAGQPMRFVNGHMSRMQPKGPDSPHWRGGRITNKAGYVFVYVPDHPKADKDGYVSEHRLIAERKMARPLTRGEHVHHINGVKDDNRPENLVVLTKVEHHKAHAGEALKRWGVANPDKLREGGRKGAEARWRGKQATP